MSTHIQTTTYTHDGAGRVTQRVVKTDERREMTTWDLDAAGLVIRETVETEYFPLNLMCGDGNAKAAR